MSSFSKESLHGWCRLSNTECSVVLEIVTADTVSVDDIFTRSCIYSYQQK